MRFLCPVAAVAVLGLSGLGTPAKACDYNQRAAIVLKDTYTPTCNSASYTAPAQAALLAEIVTPYVGSQAIVLPVSAYGGYNRQPVIVQKQIIRKEVFVEEKARGRGRGQRLTAGRGGAPGDQLFGFIENAVGTADRLVGGNGDGNFLRGAITARFLPGGGGFRFKK